MVDSFDSLKAISAYEYQPHLGERLSTNIRPALFLLDFRTPTNITVSAVNPSNLDHASGIYFRQPTVAPRAGQDEPIILYAVGSSLLPDGRRPGAIVRC